MFNLNDYEIAARQEKSRDDTRVLAREASLAKLQSRLVVVRLTFAKRYFRYFPFLAAELSE